MTENNSDTTSKEVKELDAAQVAPNSEIKKVDNKAEGTLKTLATTILILGIIGTIICLFTLCFIKVTIPGYHYLTETKFNPAGFATTIMVLFSTLISWSVMNVLANISLTLKNIDEKMN